MAAPGASTTPEAALALVSALAHDSLEGRSTGEPGSVKAATIIAREMSRAGLEPAGDSGYLQRIPVAIGTRVVNDREVRVPLLAASFAALDSIANAKRRPAYNVIGRLRGADSALAREHVLIGAHYDHVGIRTPIEGDSIYNGADDDASGAAAVLEIAGLLARGARPRRTIVFAAWTGEEVGGLGARWYIDHPVLPLGEVVANLEIEMIGRPDSLAGGRGKAWLAGYERSTMGTIFATAGLPIRPDKRPSQNFFQRSDNYPFAQRGIVAHTLSSFNLHADYHRPSDEAERIDARHLAAVINVAAQAVRLLADGEKPVWKPGGRPAAPARVTRP